MLRVIACILTILIPVGVSAQQAEGTAASEKPPLAQGGIPRTRWDHKPKAELWTRSALAALETHGTPLTKSVPRDIEAWCPAYRTAPERARKAFWVGFLSALAKHESTWRAEAVGGGGRWFGLLQIVPSTARLYKCRARTGADLKNGPDNLSCAVRIMAKTVIRDGVIASGPRGVAADWGPLRSPSKRKEMMAWTAKQSYCRPMAAVRPKPRPAGFEATALRVSANLEQPHAQFAGIRPVLRPTSVEDTARNSLAAVVGTGQDPVADTPEASPEEE